MPSSVHRLLRRDLDVDSQGAGAIALCRRIDADSAIGTAMADGQRMPNTHQVLATLLCTAFGISGLALMPNEAQAFEFSGLEWQTKETGRETMGPGPNRWRDDNVWIDETGRLHMVIRRENDGNWTCAEIYTNRNVGYGRYTMQLDTPIDDFDAHAVLGFFTWSNESPNNEMDVEIARFEGPRGANLYFSVQPNTESFDIRGRPWGSSEHTFTWMPRLVTFESIALGPGGENSSPITSRMTKGIYVPTRTTKLHINFWLHQGKRPMNAANGVMEVVIGAVEFAPQ